MTAKRFLTEDDKTGLEKDVAAAKTAASSAASVAKGASTTAQEAIELARAGTNIRTYTELAQIGMTDSSFSSTDFKANIVKLADYFAGKNFIMQMHIEYSKMPQWFRSVTNKLSSDLGVEHGTTTNLELFIRGMMSASTETGTIQIDIVSDNYGLNGTVFSCFFTRSLLGDDISTARINVDAVPTSRKVNGKPLNSDITLSASDVGALPLKGSGFITAYPTKEGFHRVAGDDVFENMTPDSRYGLLIMFGAVYKLHMFITSKGTLYWGYTDNYTEPSEWHEAGDVSKLLPLEGGTLTGDLFIEKTFPRLQLKNPVTGRTLAFLTSDDYVEIENKLDDTNSRAIRIKPETEDAEGSVYIDELVNGLHKSYQLFGEHNKPSGIYVGAGNTTEKRIAIGAKVTSVLIQSNQGMAIVGIKGAMYSESAGTIKWTNNVYIDTSTNEIVIKSNDVAVNCNGVVYDWKSL